MQTLFIIPEVTLYLLSLSGIMIVLSIALYHTLYILKYSDKKSTTHLQYQLEKRAYLISTLIKLTFYILLFLLLFLTYTIDKLAHIIPGAMCGAGVVSANIYGSPLIALEFLILIFALFWLRIHNEDITTRNHPYFRKKLYGFILLYTLIALAYVLSFLFFSHLSMQTPVLCCSHLYTQQSQPKFLQNIHILVLLFYMTYGAIVFSLYKKYTLSVAFFALLFIPLSYYSMTYFFSTYIYELPTHKCPYCVLNAHYYYIGYFIYGSFILANYATLTTLFLKFRSKEHYFTILYYTLFVLLISLKFITYYGINGKIF